MRSIFIKAVCMTAILSSPLIAFSQQYYVVVGAFPADEGASERRGVVSDPMADTSAYTLSDTEDVLQFYLLKTSDKQSAIRKTLQLKSAFDSWSETSPSTSGVAFSTLAAESAPETSSSAGASAVAANAGAVPPKPAGKYFKFKIESPEGQIVPGKIHHVDFDDGRELGTYNANTFVDLLRPAGSNEPMAMVFSRFGYKEVHKYVDYANPTKTDNDAYVDAQGVWVIPYRLERVESGDVSVMHNVSFYKDAALMGKSSQADLNELVAMMHKNPYYEITIHAHCNGKKKREVLALGPRKNYFDVDGSVRLRASARDLTALRAEAIRSYLVDHGIDQQRVNVFSWGGSDMLVREDSPGANVNDRIEIEFTRD